jgi:tRNA pseudouridine32 synthase/23S rRNA pseudouridine746 synthase
VVDKPSRLLSVPGRTGDTSLEVLLRQQYGRVYMVHRLDMDTSGLMVVARTLAAYHHLQRQFLERSVHKEYIALLEGTVTTSGTIRLPLRPDLTDRPRQLVDPIGGKEAVTDYKPLAQQTDGRTLIRLTPHTGRTHQLRVHCAHAEGLGAPIVGDALYGHTSRGASKQGERLCLHAARLQFTHPATGQRMCFTSDPGFVSNGIAIVGIP